jgi:hypothetical protein
MQAVVYILRFVLLISMLIPISMKVTLDAVQVRSGCSVTCAQFHDI